MAKTTKVKDTMELWDNVCGTNPKYTKKVDFGRKFTAIDAMYQVREATRAFGVCGEGWGFSFSDPTYPPNGTVVIKCTVWHGSKDNTVEQFGQKSLGSTKADEDCFKKAATDGLTKCLSYLGFNADVFLGLFDDNKYLANQEKMFSHVNAADGDKQYPTSTEFKKVYVRLQTEIQEANIADLVGWEKDNIEELRKIAKHDKQSGQCLRDLINERLKEGE